MQKSKTNDDGRDGLSETDLKTVRKMEGIARRIPLLKVGYGSQLAATLIAGNMAGNNNLNLKLFLSKERLCTKIKP